MKGDKEKLLAASIDTIIEMIIDGKTYRQIAKHFEVGLGTLHTFLTYTEHSARAREALIISANSYADKAEEILQEAEGTKEELMRARELAQHYRWKASKRNGIVYGDKQQLEHTGKDGKDLFNGMTDEELESKIKQFTKKGK